jgi:hypothetical protein
MCPVAEKRVKAAGNAAGLISLNGDAAERLER